MAFTLQSPAPPVTYGFTTGNGSTTSFALTLPEIMSTFPPSTNFNGSPGMANWTYCVNFSLSGESVI